MRAARAALAALAVVAAGAMAGGGPGASAEDWSDAVPPAPAPGTIRFATYNASLNRGTPGELVRDLATGHDAQARVIAAVLRRVRPDVLLINEFDYDDAHAALQLFHDRYLADASAPDGSAPLHYADAFTAPVNTGVPSGFDLDNDGRIGGGGDALGFGLFPGQYGLAVYSRFPIDRAALRTFRELRWRDMPAAVPPPGWYGDAEWAALRLSSKSHWDLPLRVDARRRIHLLASHPTPPAFDGAEDRNGRRNHDEIRFWVDYLGGRSAGWIVDDAGRRGGLAPGAHFVLAGDLNADPDDGGSFDHAVRKLLRQPRIRSTPAPRSAGGAAAALRQGGSNAVQAGDPAEDTADFSDGARSPGNLRADYVLPSRTLRLCASGVFWPAGEAGSIERASDHRLVWIDVSLDAHCSRSDTPTGQ